MAGKLPGLRQLHARSHRRHLPHIPLCQKSAQWPLRRTPGGLCEINLAREIVPEVPCAWLQIYDRLSTLGELDRLLELSPPKDWSHGDAAGPRRVLRPDQQA